MASRLTKEALLAVDDIVTQELEVPEWGGSILLRSFSLKSRRDLVEQSTVNGKVDNKLFSQGLLVIGIAEPVLTMEEAEKMQEKSALVVDRVLAKIVAMNGLDQKGADDVKKSFRPE